MALLLELHRYDSSNTLVEESFRGYGSPCPKTRHVPLAKGTRHLASGHINYFVSCAHDAGVTMTVMGGCTIFRQHGSVIYALDMELTRVAAKT